MATETPVITLKKGLKIRHWSSGTTRCWVAIKDNLVVAIRWMDAHGIDSYKERPDRRYTKGYRLVRADTSQAFEQYRARMRAELAELGEVFSADIEQHNSDYAHVTIKGFAPFTAEGLRFDGEGCLV